MNSLLCISNKSDLLPQQSTASQESPGYYQDNKDQEYATAIFLL
jgi:hypothetical protein